MSGLCKDDKILSPVITRFFETILSIDTAKKTETVYTEYIPLEEKYKKENKETEFISLSFKFNYFSLEIEHSALNSAGNFINFILRAIKFEASIDDISNIIQIDKIFIEKQLDYCISRKYLDSDYQILESGKNLLNIYNFVNEYKENKIIVALDYYIKDIKDREIYMMDDFKEISSAPLGMELRPCMSDYKLRGESEKIVDVRKDRIIANLKEKFPENSDLIEQEKEEFIFKLLPVIKTEQGGYKKNNFYLNMKIGIEYFFNILVSEETSCEIMLPILEIKNNCTLKTNNELLKSEFQLWKETNSNFLLQRFNLVNGKKIDFTYNDFREYKRGISRTEIPEFVNIENIENDGEITIPVKLFNCLEKREDKRIKHILMYLTEDKLKELIKEGVENERH